MQYRFIQSAALFALFAVGCRDATANRAPAVPPQDNHRITRIAGNTLFDGKEPPKTDKPLPITAGALRGKWEWNRPDPASIVLEFRDSTDFAHTYNAQGNLTTNLDGRAQLSVDIPNGVTKLALAWGLDSANRRGWLADAEDEVGPPGPERSAVIQLIRDDVLQIKGRLANEFLGDLEFDAFLVKAAPKKAKEIDNVDELVRWLGRDSHKQDRLAAADLLQEADHPPAKETVPILLGWIKEPDKEIRLKGLNTLAVVFIQTKGECPLAAVEAVFDKDEEVSWLASSLLVCYASLPSEAVPLLFRAIEHTNRNVRCDIPQILVKAAREDKRTVRALKKALEDNDWQVRSNAAPALFDITHDFDLVVPYWLLAIERAQKLSESAPAQQPFSPRSVEEMKAVAAGAAMALRNHGRDTPRELGECLVRLLSDDSPRMCSAAARTLGAIAGDRAKSKAALRDVKAHEAIVKLLTDSDASVRQAAKTAIEKLED